MQRVATACLLCCISNVHDKIWNKYITGIIEFRNGDNDSCWHILFNAIILLLFEGEA